MHKSSESELEFTDTIIMEVVATNSYYFGELVVVTHRAYALGVEWLKGRLPHGEWVWFKVNELEDVEL